MIDLSGSAYQAPALDLYYQRDLKHNQTLVFNVVGTYNQTKSTRIYQESKHEQLLTDVNNVVDGDKYSIIGEAIYEKKLTNGNPVERRFNAITNLSRITVISMGITIRRIWNRWRVPYMRSSREG
mgnify:CR=1 FL=1